MLGHFLDFYCACQSPRALAEGAPLIRRCTLTRLIIFLSALLLLSPLALMSQSGFVIDGLNADLIRLALYIILVISPLTVVVITAFYRKRKAVKNQTSSDEAITSATSMWDHIYAIGYRARILLLASTISLIIVTVWSLEKILYDKGICCAVNGVSTSCSCPAGLQNMSRWWILAVMLILFNSSMWLLNIVAAASSIVVGHSSYNITQVFFSVTLAQRFLFWGIEQVELQHQFFQTHVELAIPAMILFGLIPFAIVFLMVKIINAVSSIPTTRKVE